MRIDPKALVRRLTPTATQALEGAVARAAQARFYEVLPEHLLLELLTPDDGDGACLLAHFGVSRTELLTRVERALQDVRTGHAGRPILSQALFSWLREAWLVASVERGAALVRSADLLASFAEEVDRYTAASLSELEALPHALLRTQLHDSVLGSRENAELEPSITTTSARPEQACTASGALARFTVSLTQQARTGQVDPVLGRHREIRQMIDILARRRKNNPILVGEPGVGKTALVEGLALAIVGGEVPESLLGVELVALDLGALQAGASARGEFEQRLKNVIHEVKASAVPIVLFIDEAHTLIGAGGAQGTGDAANLLKPELARGTLRTIAATTWTEYKKYFEKDAALERRFQPVKVDEPTEEDTIAILRGLRDTYESAHDVIIRDDALVAAARLSHRYIPGRQLPDKAVDLLDTAAARAKTERGAKPDALLELESRVAATRRAATALARDLADDSATNPSATTSLQAALQELEQEQTALRLQWERERRAAEQQTAARRQRRARISGTDGDATPNQRETTADMLAVSEAPAPLARCDVDAEAVARIVHSWTGIPVGKLHASSVRAALELEQTLHCRIKGQHAAIKAVAEAVRMSSAGVANPDAPRAVLLFVGTSGVGKTETALALAEQMFGGEHCATTVAMSEFQEKHSLSRLIGSPPGYVGYGEGGVLTEAVRRRPYSLVLLDECEKADPEVMNLFYQVFDKGTLSDGEGRAVSFRNTIIVLTSNLATDVIARMHERGAAPSTDELLAAIRPALSRHFKPALLARMSVVPFVPVSGDILTEIASLKLARLAERVRVNHRAQLSFAPQLADRLAALCTDADAGARNIEHVMRASLLPVLSREILRAVADAHAFESIHITLEHGDFLVEVH